MNERMNALLVHQAYTGWPRTATITNHY